MAVARPATIPTKPVAAILAHAPATVASIPPLAHSVNLVERFRGGRRGFGLGFGRCPGVRARRRRSGGQFGRRR
jgi:hypothetical protein